MSVLHYANSAVSVAQAIAHRTSLAAHLMHVGFYTQGSNHLTNRIQLFQSVGLLQFLPIDLPEGCKVSSVRLCLPIYEPSFRPMRIGLFQNMNEYNSHAVTYQTRPAIMQVPIAQFQVNPDMRWKYVTCDITVVFRNCHGNLPAIGFTLLSLDSGSGMVSFCGQNQAYMPYLEILCKPQEETKEECHEEAQLVQNVFKERIFHVKGDRQDLHTPIMTTAGVETITFFVKNTGTHPLEFHLQISPDGMNYLDDPQIFDVEPCGMKAAAPCLFGKFMRVSVRPLLTGTVIAACVWCQAQTKNYMVQEIACRTDIALGDSLSMSLPGDATS